MSDMSGMVEPADVFNSAHLQNMANFSGIPLGGTFALKPGERHWKIFSNMGFKREAPALLR